MMDLKEHVQSMVRPGEKFVVVSPFCMMRLMPDGSAIMYKTNMFRLQFIVLSRHDLEFIKGMTLPVRMFTPGPESEKDVHTEHCCVVHGCKYGENDTCPVTTETKKQSGACEYCYMDAEGFVQEEHPFCGWREE